MEAMTFAAGAGLSSTVGARTRSLGWALREWLRLHLPRLGKAALSRFEIRLQAEYGKELNDRGLDATLGKVGIAEVVVRLHVIGPKANGFFEVNRGEGGLSLASQCVAQIVLRGSAFWRQGQGCLEVLHRLRKSALGDQHIPQIIVRFSVIRKMRSASSYCFFASFSLARF